MSAFSISSVIGVPLGLAISDFSSWNMSFFSIAFFGLIITFLAFIIFPEMSTHVEANKQKRAIKELLNIASKKEYFKSYAMIFFVAFSTFCLIPFLSPFSVKNVGIKTTDLKYLYLIGGFFTVFSARLLGKLTDQHGAFKVFSIVIPFSAIPILLYTHAEPMQLWKYLMLTTFFMMIVSGRMIPGMTLLSSVPHFEDRGTFMGIMNSVRSLGSALAALVAGMIIIEQPDGQLLRFNLVGYMSIAMMLIILPLGYKISKQQEN